MVDHPTLAAILFLVGCPDRHNLFVFNRKVFGDLKNTASCLTYGLVGKVNQVQVVRL